MGKLSRRKGASHECAIVALAHAAGFPRAKRTAPMQAGHEDDFPDVSDVAFLWLEGKHEARCRPRAYAREYLVDRPGFVPVVCWRENGMGPADTVAEMKLTDLLKIVRELCDLRQRCRPTMADVLRADHAANEEGAA